jgi:dTDP-4-dehydrorhamnose reductase
VRIIVTGREGQVARALAERGPGFGHEIVLLARPELDLAANAETISEALAAARPEAIISAAAYTAVDKAEGDAEQAFRVNAQGAGAVAAAAARLTVPLVHLSTDYVFDGTKAAPYVEDDATGPTGVYGASKLAGEQAVMEANPNSAILRTAWVYSPFGANFVRTMLRLAADKEEVAVVADQRGNPTSALDIADGVLAVVENLVSRDDPLLRGTFHMAGEGEASWAEFAEAIFAEYAEAVGPTAQVRQIATSDYPTPARRPANSRLDCSKLARVHGFKLPGWRRSTKEVVQRLVRRTV